MFGNFGSVSLLGWTGVGWVASGIYIKMNRSFDPPAAAGLNGQPATKDYESVSTSEHEEVQSKPAAMPATQCAFLPPSLIPVADAPVQSRTSTSSPSPSPPSSSSSSPLSPLTSPPLPSMAPSTAVNGNLSFMRRSSPFATMIARRSRTMGRSRRGSSVSRGAGTAILGAWWRGRRGGRLVRFVSPFSPGLPGGKGADERW